MQKKHVQSPNSLFLLELILLSLFLAIACSVCVRLYALSWDNQREAARLQHIRALTTQVGEFLEGWDGNPETLSDTLGTTASDQSSDQTDSTFLYAYDRHWEHCPVDEAMFTLTLTMTATDTAKEAELLFSDKESVLSQETIRFPLPVREEAAHGTP